MSTRWPIRNSYDRLGRTRTKRLSGHLPRPEMPKRDMRSFIRKLSLIWWRTGIPFISSALIADGWRMETVPKYALIAKGHRSTSYVSVDPSKALHPRFLYSTRSSCMRRFSNVSFFISHPFQFYRFMATVENRCLFG